MALVERAIDTLNYRLISEPTKYEKIFTRGRALRRVYDVGACAK
jgi:hypothetical protein